MVFLRKWAVSIDSETLSLFVAAKGLLELAFERLFESQRLPRWPVNLARIARITKL